jgi:hypothetical protein
MKVIAALNVLIGAFLATGGITELTERGLGNREVVAAAVGTIGAVASLWLAYSGIVLWHGERDARRRAVLAAIACATFHTFAALLPPHYAGTMVMVLSVTYAALVIAVVGFPRGSATLRQRV